MTDYKLATAPRSMNGNGVGAELVKARQRVIQLELENARLQRRADKYEGLFYTALSLLAILGSAWMLQAWG